MLGSLNCYLRFDVDCNQQTLNLVTTLMPVAFPDVCVTTAVVPLPTALSFSCAQIELDYQNGPMSNWCSCKEQTLLW